MVQCYVVRCVESRWQFLQLRRAATDFMGGTWQTVYGRIEAGETAWEAALRELREETALAARELYQLDTVNTFYLAKDDAIWMCPGFCAIVDADARPELNEEHDALRWLAREQYLGRIVWPGERLAVDELCREILDNGPSKEHLRIRLP